MPSERVAPGSTTEVRRKRESQACEGSAQVKRQVSEKGKKHQQWGLGNTDQVKGRTGQEAVRGAGAKIR